ncbi:Amino acid oxidase [Gulosibacter molinativorax]|nr:Amino acid oxidase [Gulosibacter molinativorax]
MTDEGNPDGLTYIFPREHDVIVGGTADEGSWDTEIDPATEAAILERALKLVPELANQPLVGRACGLRPARPSISLERLTVDGVPVITAYGHGGAGVTLSWGTAERVVELAAADED